MINELRRLDAKGIGGTWLVCWLVFCGAAIGSRADETPRFEVLGKDGRRWRGAVTGDAAGTLKVVAESGEVTALGDVLSLELPDVPRALPDRGWRRLTLGNGDRLHAKLVPGSVQNQPLNAAQHSVAGSEWTTGFGDPVTLPLSALWRIEHLPGTRSLVYQDFESDAAAWVNLKGEPVTPRPERGRSGKSSLQLSADQSWLRYAVTPALSGGWMEFSFFLDDDSDRDGEVAAALQFSGLPVAESIRVQLAGPGTWYTVTAGKELRQRLIVPRRAGWHTLSVQLQPERLRLTIDGYLLLDESLRPGSSPQLTAVSLTADQTAARVSIDDFAVTATVTDRPLATLQVTQDEIDLFEGDQLFGKVGGLSPAGVALAGQSHRTVIPWRDLRAVKLAPRKARPIAVHGWIAAIDLQPGHTSKSHESADVLHGALLSVNAGGCVLEHCLLGKLSLPWGHIRRLRPAYFGMSLPIEARPFHLGNEVKSALQMRVPSGTQYSRTFALDEVPAGTTFMTLTATDLEPAGPGTREHRWLSALRAGELTSELWLNGRRIVVLNAEISGKGPHAQMQRLRIKLPEDALKAGKNVVEVRLQPVQSESSEYDDWELSELGLEVVTALPMSGE